MRTASSGVLQPFRSTSKEGLTMRLRADCSMRTALSVRPGTMGTGCPTKGEASFLASLYPPSNCSRIWTSGSPGHSAETIFEMALIWETHLSACPASIGSVGTDSFSLAKGRVMGEFILSCCSTMSKTYRCSF